jgi:hypothetical protein
MKRLLKITLVIIFLSGLTAFWYFVDDKDYFNSNYMDLTEQQNKIFKWQDEDRDNSIRERYKQYFTDKELKFPRQQVSKVKLFKNIPIVSILTGRTLKQNQIDSFLNFCNDSTNFDWGETTWGLTEAEYFIRLYNSKDIVVGKIYFCLADCGHIDARPFSPSMKFGMLSTIGLAKINKIINEKDKWE